MMGSTGSVGNWEVTVTPLEVTAGKRGSSLTYSAGVHLFPVGFKVSKVWSPEQPPKTVIALANKLAKRVSY